MAAAASYSNIPIPDPSLITAQEIARAKVELRDEFTQLIGGLKEIVNTRLDAADRAKELLARDFDKRQQITDGLLADLKSVQTAADQVVDARAQAANDALERLLNSSINATTSISDVRHEATQLAITKVESQLTSAFVASKAAIDAALTTANSAVEAVDRKSQMRSDAVEQHLRTIEEKLGERMVSLKQLIDLGTEMGREAINKAESATTLRFESVNEFRQTLTDQAANFVSRATLEAIQAQMASSINSLDTQMQAYASAAREGVASLRTELAGLKSTVLVGGSTIVVVLLVIQLAVNIFGTHGDASSTSGANKRLDDLQSELMLLQRDRKLPP